MDASTLATLLEQQTQRILTSNREVVEEAVARVKKRTQAQGVFLEKKVMGKVNELKMEMHGRLEGAESQLVAVHGRPDCVALLQAAQEKLQTMVDGLIAKVGDAEVGRVKERLPWIIFGGWPPHTHKTEILQHLEKALRSAEARQLLDDAPWVPGVRKHYALALFRQRPAESKDDLRGRMMEVVTKMQAAQWQGSSDDCGVADVFGPPSPVPLRKEAWASGQHASKVRKMLYLLKHGVGGCECEYASGSVWLYGRLVGSATMSPPPGVNVGKGRVQGSWIDLHAVADLLCLGVRDVEAAWNQAWRPN